jgi:hypothetical protein
VNLSDQSIQDFIEAWKQDFGEVLSPETARSEATRLLEFFAWMIGELNHQESAKNIPPPQSGGHGDVRDDARRAWRKMMKRRLNDREEM